MLKIVHVSVENLTKGCITDARPPRVSFALESDRPGARLDRATLRVGAWQTETCEQLHIPIQAALAPFTAYTAEVTAVDDAGETATAEVTFETGRMGTPWAGTWITDPGYRFTEKKVSPKPMLFRRKLALRGPVAWARVYATAMGVYELALDGRKIGQDYFAPGFTSYPHQLQYQTYDVTDVLRDGAELTATVAGGWAVGSSVFNRVNRVTADRQALLLELRIRYADGAEELIGTDQRWQVTEDGPLRAAEFYDGEVYDATVDPAAFAWRQAAPERLRVHPALLAEYGDLVRAQETLRPVSQTVAPSGEIVYDFGQNFAGVIAFTVRGHAGQKLVFRHAEVMNEGELFVRSLRTAKATLEYTCREGEQRYSPRLTYMGFRYVGMTGAKPEDVELSALVLQSDFPQTGSFACSNEAITRLQSNIHWSGRSNFVDIPTDCPQRDERLGWTGDLSVFASTACFNFDLSRFLNKWLLDLRSEQLLTGGIPVVVPRQGLDFKVQATSCWGDSCATVPWAEYWARGDKALLARQYPSVKRFIRAARFWSRKGSHGKYERRIWAKPFHYGDWCAPGEDFPEWTAKAPWVATAYLYNTCRIAARMAGTLNKPAEAARYDRMADGIAEAYRKVFTDGQGKLNKEFQTAYVLPLYFGMAQGDEAAHMADHLARLARENGDRLSTGFTGTPYLTFALSDHGHADEAYKLLLQEQCPSWLYEVKAGGTTIWERWDALRPDGTINTGEHDGDAGMVSFNHYANGAVGDWLYRRVAGLEATEPGYLAFRVAPLPGGGLTWAKAAELCPYGEIRVAWRIGNGQFELEVVAPVSTTCEVCLPDGSARTVGSGSHQFACAMQ